MAQDKSKAKQMAQNVGKSVRVSAYEAMKKCDKVGYIRRYHSASALHMSDCKISFVTAQKRPKKMIKNLLLLQEVFLSMNDNYALVYSDFKKECLTLYEKVKAVLNESQAYKGMSDFSLDSLMEKLERVPDESFVTAMKEYWRKEK